jgi:hypothetical protein
LKPLLVRLTEKIRVLPNGCWEWTAAKQKGYGTISVGTRPGGGSIVARAHRLVYEMAIGPIPSGLEPDHLCRNRACVNPWHLEPVTHLVNVQRGPNPRSLQTHCKHGHEFTPDNTICRAKNRRGCRACGIEDARAYRARRKSSA